METPKCKHNVTLDSECADCIKALKPCPFCGTNDDLHVYDGDGVHCACCGAKTGSQQKSKEVQIKIWNVRSTQAIINQDKKIAGLEQKLNKCQSVMADISSMCVGELTMNYKLDAMCIGEMIYQATGMTQPELEKSATVKTDNSQVVINQAKIIEELNGLLIIAKELIFEVTQSHQDKHSGDYNDCESGLCQWCEEAQPIITREFK